MTTVPWPAVCRKSLLSVIFRVWISNGINVDEK